MKASDISKVTNRTLLASGGEPVGVISAIHAIRGEGIAVFAEVQSRQAPQGNLLIPLIGGEVSHGQISAAISLEDAIKAPVILPETVLSAKRSAEVLKRYNLSAPLPLSGRRDLYLKGRLTKLLKKGRKKEGWTPPPIRPIRPSRASRDINA
ncbi:hypothetical protein [Streptomyces sp. NPDC006355]|uniref:hypothetical protein n=1 Tax=Streptomyces sp. NPDC006355 TaxID=3156758 RepID=UPI0033A94D92